MILCMYVMIDTVTMPSTAQTGACVVGGQTEAVVGVRGKGTSPGCSSHQVGSA